jgi:Reverse transcriptase (RNA-dependent DNA polymerase)
MPIGKGDQWKTAFYCEHRVFEFVVMPFGRTNAPSCFQHLVTLTLRNFLGRGVKAYLDDILVHSASMFDHLNLLDTVFSCLSKYGLVAKASKCVFC